jgi:hypothetical protein
MFNMQFTCSAHSSIIKTSNSPARWYIGSRIPHVCDQHIQRRLIRTSQFLLQQVFLEGSRLQVFDTCAESPSQILLSFQGVLATQQRNTLIADILIFSTHWKGRSMRHKFMTLGHLYLYLFYATTGLRISLNILIFIRIRKMQQMKILSVTHTRAWHSR